MAMKIQRQQPKATPNMHVEQVRHHLIHIIIWTSNTNVHSYMVSFFMDEPYRPCWKRRYRNSWLSTTSDECEPQHGGLCARVRRTSLNSLSTIGCNSLTKLPYVESGSTQMGDRSRVWPYWYLTKPPRHLAVMPGPRPQPPQAKVVANPA